MQMKTLSQIDMQMIKSWLRTPVVDQEERACPAAAARGQRPAAGSHVLVKLLSFLALAVFAGAADPARGQELMRGSLVSDGPNVTTGGSTGSSGDYNLRVGPIRFLAEVTGGFEYIDNINYSEHNRQSDEVVRLSLNIRTLWTLSQYNTLQLDLGVGFIRYIQHSEATSGDVFITPGSQLAANIYVGDRVRINVHDAFDIRQDPVDNASLSGVTNFARFTNTAGVTVTADLNPITLTVGYDHFNYVSLNSEFDYLNRNSDSVLASVVYKVQPGILVGVEGNYSWYNYSNNSVSGDFLNSQGVVVNGASNNRGLNDGEGGSVGAYFDWTISRSFRLTARGGYQEAHFDNNGFFSQNYGDDDNLSTFYWNVTLNNRLNAYFTQSLAGGRESDLGLTSNYITVNYVRYNLAWRATNALTVAGDLFYENDQESGGLFDEHLQRFGGDVSLGFQFNMHLSGALHYTYIRKDSDTADRSYYQNRVGVDVGYRF